jgi:hypothetical protein
MRQQLCKRLEDLEKISAAAAQRVTSHALADSALEDLRAMLVANDFPQEPNESLAETFARFLGVKSRELGGLLEGAYHRSQPLPAGGI